jgi:hypothetical protein
MTFTKTTDFYKEAQKEKTSIKRDATSNRIMEFLANSNYYAGEKNLSNGSLFQGKNPKIISNFVSGVF